MITALKRGWPLAAAAIAIAMSGPATAGPLAGLASGTFAQAGIDVAQAEPAGAYRTSKHSRRRHASRYHDPAYRSGSIAIYETPTFGLYFGEQAYGPNGCRYPYSGYMIDQPCWAQKAFAPPRYR
ncbi:MAG: hypothetical protein GC150_02700 [Rhizobiales bacterium]|nr:hypothetical protein [Hyphomicrobiales bacterium]